MSDWDQIVFFARKFHKLDDFQEFEYNYKLRVAGALEQSVAAVRTNDPGWPSLLRAAITHKENNLVPWRATTPYLKWLKNEAELALVGLDALWDTDVDPISALGSFFENLPADVVPDQSNRIALGSFLLSGREPTNLPVYRSSPFNRLRKMLGRAKPSLDDAALYSDGLALIDEFISVAAGDGFVLRDRLESQGALYATVRWEPTDEWSPEDRLSLLEMRGEHDSGSVSSGLDAGLANWDRAAAAEELDAIVNTQREFLERFPTTVWPELPVEEYALGIPNNTDGYSYWLEFKTVVCGSIRGGSSMKHLIFKRSTTGEWYFPPRYGSVDEAWSAIRSGFEMLIEHANAGRWEEIDAIESLVGANAVRAKTCWMYFPDELLPIYAESHLDFFLKIFGVSCEAQGSVGKNRALFEALTDLEAFEDLSPMEIGIFLYGWSNPNPSETILKVAPGEKASLWDECRRDSVIRVGWDELGSFADYDNLDDFKAAYVDLTDTTNKSTATRTCRMLIKFRDLKKGDLIVANRGLKAVVGIGRVTTGYAFRPDLADHQHVVGVDWFDTTERTFDGGPPWRVTISDLKPDVYHQILNSGSGSLGPGPKPASPLPEIPALHHEAEKLLDRSKQLIFYGPPGTGKTFSARRHAAWLLGGGSVIPEAARAFGTSDELSAIEEQFTRTGVENSAVASRLTQVTFHPTYSYEDFIEGYKPTESGSGGLELHMRDGIFKRVCIAAAADQDNSYVILIDEINRGNVPKIFGELITLIENDKRGLTLSLPQSGQSFSVPSNLFLIATMNTADRSIHVLDAALRRRFAFLELLPEPAVLADTTIGALSLEDFLDGLNTRIRKMIGREKQVGHAIFMDHGRPIKGLASFALAFRYELLPLLQEYCYGDYRDLEALLGSGIIDVESQTPRPSVLEDPERLVAALADHLVNDLL